jgi:hypothetical protein
MAFERWRSSREEDDWRRRMERAREDDERDRRSTRDEYDDRSRWGEEYPREARDRYRDDSWAERESERYGTRFEPWTPRRRERAYAEPSYAGRGPSRYCRSDERIYEDVNDRLTDHPGIDATDIEVVVVESVVTLKGFVQARDQKRMADEVAEGVPGVRDVRNELRVGAAFAGSRGIPLEEHSQSARDERATERLPQLMRPREARDDLRDEGTVERVRRDDETRERALRDDEARPAVQHDEGVRNERRVRPGMAVVDGHGQRVGEVKEAYSDVFHLDRPMRRDLYVPYDAILEIGERHVVLRFHADELDKLNWDVPDLIGMGRRRH